ncbi:hypothetical protein PCL_06269 [Purpureocillium lilacinum]|uniref:Uncharacterized protein n=1 Tax=Purpureocillium lilacinum TaxID=33203 RepID=A0A2U3EM79_PURLI|nr:hypothetical protein PCL_06269 [Purpureocillium lilacinum]
MRVSVDVPRQGEQTCDASAAPELCLARRPQDLAELQAVAGRLPCLVGVCQARARFPLISPPQHVCSSTPLASGIRTPAPLSCRKQSRNKDDKGLLFVGRLRCGWSVARGLLIAGQLELARWMSGCRHATRWQVSHSGCVWLAPWPFSKPKPTSTQTAGKGPSRHATACGSRVCASRTVSLGTPPAVEEPSIESQDGSDASRLIHRHVGKTHPGQRQALARDILQQAASTLAPSPSLAGPEPGFLIPMRHTHLGTRSVPDVRWRFSLAAPLRRQACWASRPSCARFKETMTIWKGESCRANARPHRAAESTATDNVTVRPFTCLVRRKTRPERPASDISGPGPCMWVSHNSTTQQTALHRLPMPAWPSLTFTVRKGDPPPPPGPEEYSVWRAAAAVRRDTSGADGGSGNAPPRYPGRPVSATSDWERVPGIPRLLTDGWWTQTAQRVSQSPSTPRPTRRAYPALPAALAAAVLQQRVGRGGGRERGMREQPSTPGWSRHDPGLEPLARKVFVR